MIFLCSVVVVVVVVAAAVVVDDDVVTVGVVSMLIAVLSWYHLDRSFHIPNIGFRNLHS
jgi:hypothetical protein